LDNGHYIPYSESLTFTHIYLC